MVSYWLIIKLLDRFIMGTTKEGEEGGGINLQKPTHTSPTFVNSPLPLPPLTEPLIATKICWNILKLRNWNIPDSKSFINDAIEFLTKKYGRLSKIKIMKLIYINDESTGVYIFTNSPPTPFLTAFRISFPPKNSFKYLIPQFSKYKH